MAKDDYNVVVYKILKYLYKCLKTGEDVKIEYITPEELEIPESYWKYIIIHLYEDGLIEKLKVCNLISAKDNPQISFQKSTTITPAGIEFLLDNSLMKKAGEFLSTVSDVVAFWK